MSFKDSKPRVGDLVKILDEELKGATGIVRMVYANLAISVVLNEMTVPLAVKNALVRDPHTKGIHWIVGPGDYEIYKRRIYS